MNQERTIDWTSAGPAPTIALMKSSTVLLVVVSVGMLGCVSGDPSPGGDAPASTPLAIDRVRTVARIDPGGSAPIVVPGSFEALPLGDQSGQDTLVVSWTDYAAGTIRTGLFEPDHATFTELPAIPGALGVPFAMAVGGPPSARQLYLTWVAASPPGLTVAMIDPTSGRLTPPRVIAEATGIVRPAIAGSDLGAVIAYVLPSEPAPSWSYDPWALRLDLHGEVLSTELVENVSTQTLGIAVAAWHGGAYAVAYATSGQQNRLRRHGADGTPLEAPVELGWFRAGYQPWLTALSADGSQSYILLAGASAVMTDGSTDMRMFRGGLTGPLAAVRSLGEAAPELIPPALGLAGMMMGGRSCVTVAWQEVLERDPDYVGCLEAPPTHVELRAQPMCDSAGMQPAAPPIDVLDWRRAEPTARAPEGVRVVNTAGGAIVLWSEGGQLRYRRLGFGT
jgi:hypothetical protein